MGRETRLRIGHQMAIPHDEARTEATDAKILPHRKHRLDAKIERQDGGRGVAGFSDHSVSSGTMFSLIIRRRST